MGMYTRLVLDVKLRQDTPDAMVELIHLLCQYSGVPGKIERVEAILDLNRGLYHEFFHTWRSLWMFRCTGGFGETEIPYFVRCDDGTYQLRLVFSVKNYEDCIELFLDWVSPFLIKYPEDTVVGEYQYEEAEKESTIIVRKNRIVITEIF